MGTFIDVIPYPGPYTKPNHHINPHHHVMSSLPKNVFGSGSGHRHPGTAVARRKNTSNTMEAPAHAAAGRCPLLLNKVMGQTSPMITSNQNPSLYRIHTLNTAVILDHLFFSCSKIIPPSPRLIVSLHVSHPPTSHYSPLYCFLHLTFLCLDFPLIVLPSPLSQSFSPSSQVTQPV